MSIVKLNSDEHQFGIEWKDFLDYRKILPSLRNSSILLGSFSHFFREQIILTVTLPDHEQ